MDWFEGGRKDGRHLKEEDGAIRKDQVVLLEKAAGKECAASSSRLIRRGILRKGTELQPSQEEVVLRFISSTHLTFA